MGYKLEDSEPSFGSAIGCIAVIIVLGATAVFLMIAAGAPNTSAPLWQLLIVIAMIIGVTAGVFRLVKSASDRFGGGPSH